MNLSPKASGARPRTACEISPEGVTAARGDVSGALTSAFRVALPAEVVLPGLKPGNLTDRLAVIAAVRRTLEAVGVRPNSRGAEITVIIPDGAARVLLLDFDALPTKLTEALPIVRFRLKKLLPFEAEDAMVSYQVMSSKRGFVRVLAVAIPRDVLAEYETAVREAGFEPGAVLPSTLAALPGVSAGEPALLVNCSRLGVTTAILQDEILLLHRTVDLHTGAAATPATYPPALFDGVRDAVPHSSVSNGTSEDARNASGDYRGAEEAAGYFARTDQPSDLGPEPHNPILVTSSSLRSVLGSDAELTALAKLALGMEPPAAEGARFDTNSSLQEEIAQAVSVAMAYYEDTLAHPPRHLWAAGATPASDVAQLLRHYGLPGAETLEVRELVSGPQLAGAAVSANVPLHALAGVAGALRG